MELGGRRSGKYRGGIKRGIGVELIKTHIM